MIHLEMKHLRIIVATLILLTPWPVLAESFLSVGTVILCESSSSVGFNWKHGTWHDASFYPGDKYLFRKVPAKECLEKEGFGDEDNSQRDFILRYSQVCIKFNRFGKSIPPAGDKCHELISGKQGSPLNHILVCDGGFFAPYVRLSPNGYYHMAHIHDDLTKNPKNDYKDSLSIEWGLCSVITGQ